MLKKFPVVSKNGIEYLAQIETIENIIDDESLRVRLYVKDKRRFLWMEKEYFINIQTDYYEYDNEFTHDYVNAVRLSVNNYETRIKNGLEFRNKLKEAKENGSKQFEEWNGEC